MRDSFFPGTEELRPDELRITALGTGRPFLRLAQANASWLVETGSGSKFVFDFGFGSFMRFTSLELPAGDLSALFASHLHLDHVGDFGAYWVGGWVGGRLAPLHVYGPSGGVVEHGTRHYVTKQLEASAWDAATRRGLLPAVGEEVEVHEFPWEKTQVIYDDGDTRVHAFPAVHIHDGAVSYRLEYHGSVFVYSGDSAASTIFVENGQNADLVVHEAFNTVDQLVRRSGYDRESAVRIGTIAHTSPVDAGRVFELTRPKLAVAYHFFNDFDTAPEIEHEIRQHYNGPLTLAEDLMVFNVLDGEVRVRKAIVSEHVWPNKSRHEGWGSAPRGPAPVMSQWLADARLPTDAK